MSITLGNPAPLGLLAFGMTTMMLMYVEMGWCETDFEVSIAGTAVFLGGIGQLLVAIFELLKGSSFAFAVFGCYGAFWLAWSRVFIESHRTDSTFGGADYSDGKTLFFIQWGILSTCFWVITWRKTRALLVVFTLLSSTFYLLAIANATGLDVWRRTAGYVGFFTAVSAFYTGVAELVNEEWRRHILPGLEPLYSPQRVAISENSIKNLIFYDKNQNTLFYQFRGLQIRTSSDVKAVENAVKGIITSCGAPNNMVHVVADYQDTVIAESIAHEYWDMADRMQHRYYLSTSRFNVSSFDVVNHHLGHHVVEEQRRAVAEATRKAGTLSTNKATHDQHSDTDVQSQLTQVEKAV